MKYDIENLIDIFGKHHEELLERRKKDLEKYPDNEFLQKMDDFDLSAALQAICKEIKALKNETEST